MFESKVIAALMQSRKDYDMVHNHIDKAVLSPFGLALYETLAEYYKKDTSAEKADIEILRVALDRRFKDIPRHRDKMRDKLEEVLSVETSSVNVVSEIIEQRRAEVGTHLADSLLAQDNERIEMYMQDYAELTDMTVLTAEAEEEYQGITLHELEAKMEEGGTWELTPKELARRVRSLRAGHHVVIAARPERGKTLCAISVTGGFLHQGAKVLYIGNEDPIPDLVVRLLSNLSGMTEEQMFNDKDTAMERAIKRGYERCVFAGLSPGTLYEIEALVRRHEPDILVMDQMRNVRANTENNTQRLEVVAQELRNIGRRHNCLVVSMTQAGDSARDKLILNDGDIDGSNTGIPGACDVIVMIGSNEDFERRDLRCFTLAKNKRGGDHSNFTVSVNRNLSRITSFSI